MAQSGYEEHELLSRALSAHVALARGDTSQSIALLRQLKSIDPPKPLSWGLASPFPLERLLLARLLAARQRYSEALQVAAVLDQPGPVMFLPLLPATLEVRLEAARALNLPELTEEYRRRLVALGHQPA